MKVPFVDLKAQYDEIKKDIDGAIDNVISDTAFVGGKYVKIFEEKFAEKLGSKYCIGVGNGTSALYITLRCLGVKEGDEVITAANTFIADGEAISMTGAKPVFVDCDPTTFNIDTNLLEKAINKSTKAIVPVHLYGQPCDIEPIIQIAEAYDIKVVGDACQAPCALYKESDVGTWGDAVCFSFFPGKNLGAYGDGGMVATESEELATLIKMTANHGRIKKYDHEFEGLNSRLDGMQAAILTAKLKYLDKWNDRRIQIANKYDEYLSTCVTTPKKLDQVKHVYHLYVIKTENRDELKNHLGTKGISTGIHYPTPLPFLTAYKKYGYVPEDFPISHRDKDRLLSLPIHGSMKEEEVNYVINSIKQFYDKDTKK